ncbi:hypothetical protein P152DRAFT_119632 [Eremomyces bilateralis CBS 781.70]|uniref:Uncharacterized protein n=1 Tax=Eremomyces bilateralis CBS 781.70 TaxID=1392243 RepID=A0A6G1GE14_9PEZI|nr:uncharacterized protein P152DRAFT_119632 [Eremomyces bilateralis CBS 781.70]KAF1816337.1 hypothetical protein P152DRAFT_119632 [Eremomyces bilateralis CBS 781.70]
MLVLRQSGQSCYQQSPLSCLTSLVPSESSLLHSVAGTVSWMAPDKGQTYPAPSHWERRRNYDSSSSSAGDGLSQIQRPSTAIPPSTPIGPAPSLRLSTSPTTLRGSRQEESKSTTSPLQAFRAFMSRGNSDDQSRPARKPKATPQQLEIQGPQDQFGDGRPPRSAPSTVTKFPPSSGPGAPSQPTYTAYAPPRRAIDYSPISSNPWENSSSSRRSRASILGRSNSSLVPPSPHPSNWPARDSSRLRPSDLPYARTSQGQRTLSLSTPSAEDNQASSLSPRSTRRRTESEQHHEVLDSSDFRLFVEATSGFNAMSLENSVSSPQNYTLPQTFLPAQPDFSPAHLSTGIQNIPTQLQRSISQPPPANRPHFDPSSRITSPPFESSYPNPTVVAATTGPLSPPTRRGGHQYSEREVSPVRTAPYPFPRPPPTLRPSTSARIPRRSSFESDDDSDDELPDYATSQAEASAKQRAEATRRAAELESRWANSQRGGYR